MPRPYRHPMDHYAPLEHRNTGRGPEIAEVGPARCPSGHELLGRNVQVAYGIAPDGQRRRSWRCRTCDVITWES